MKILRRLVVICLAAGCNAAAADALVADAHPSLYSFSDLYRLTVNGAVPEPIDVSPLNAEPQQVRVATLQSAPAGSEAGGTPSTEVRFTVTQVPGPGRWMLVLAGLAAMAWVAHRRLTRPL